MRQKTTLTTIPAVIEHDAGDSAVALAPRTMGDALVLSERLAASHLIPEPLRGKPDDVLVVLMKGRELGLAPMQSLSSIHVISGKAVCEASLMVGLCVSRPAVCKYFTLVESTTDHATYETLRVGSPEPVSLTYTIKEAQGAGLTSKSNWKTHPAAMLRARASGALARAAYPDLVAGIYTPDEAEEFSGPPPQTRAAMMPRRTSVAKAATTAVHGKTAPKPADSDGDEPPPPDDDDGRPFTSGPEAPPLELTAENDGPGLPEWKGKIKSVASKDGTTNGVDWTLFNIMGDDGHAFISFSESIAAAAAKMVKTEKAVRIVYDDSGRGHKIQEILPA